MLTLWTRRPLVESLPATGICSSALLLVAFPLSFALRFTAFLCLDDSLLLFALLLTWAADTAAYFVGRWIGKHPLAPHISPKKTWEGAVGSLAGSLLVVFLFRAWITNDYMHGFGGPRIDFSVPHLLAMAFIGNIAGQMGDLLESAYKRSAGVKDSGDLLPGHGGVLDRIDALILCIPAVWYCLFISAAFTARGQVHW